MGLPELARRGRTAYSLIPASIALIMDPYTKNIALSASTNAARTKIV